MADQQLKDKSGRLLGTIRQTSNGQFQGFDSSGRLKGRYDSNTDKTYDSSGRLVGSGNMLAVLITQ